MSEPAYDLLIHKGAETELASATGSDGDKVISRINEVQTTEKFAELEGVDFLRDYDSLFRIKVGRYRAILWFKQTRMEIVLLAVGNRDNIYERLPKIYNERIESS